MSRMYMYGYSGGVKTLDQMQASTWWINIDSEFRSRLLNMMNEVIDAGHSIGIGGSIRTTAQQMNLFLSRHHAVASGGCCNYSGQNWALNAGVAHAAPPGRSYHEPTTPIGKCLAVDLVGNIKYAATIATKHGLFEFSNINGELWHFQPSDIPHGRSQYNPATMHPLKSWGPQVKPVPAPVPVPAAQTMVVPSPVIKLGSTGPEVFKLQAILAFWKFYTSKQDGSCGPMTVAAIKKLQAALNQTQDGVYGTVTATAYRKLLEFFASIKK